MIRRTALATGLALLGFTPGGASAALPAGAGYAPVSFVHPADGGIAEGGCAWSNGVLAGAATSSSVPPGGEAHIRLTCFTLDEAGVLVTSTTGYATSPPVLAGPKTVMDEFPKHVCAEVEAFTSNGGVAYTWNCDPILVTAKVGEPW